MKKYIVYIICLSALTFLGCRPEPLEIKVDPVAPQVVVFSQVIPDAVMTVLLAKTIGALGFSEEEQGEPDSALVNSLLVSDAVVTINYRNETDTLFEVENGIYVSLTPPRYDQELYTLKIDTEEGEEISAQSTMLGQVPFETIEPIIELSDSDTLVRMAYSIVDPPEDNWYMVNFYTNRDVSENEEPADSTDLDLNSFFNRGSNFFVKTVLLSDQLFDNDLIMDTIDLPVLIPSDSLVVTISNISEPYHRFLDLRQTSQSLFNEIVREPINYPTNVENGLGFFNTHFPDIYFFDLNEF